MRLEILMRWLGDVPMVEFFVQNFQKPTLGAGPAGIIWKIVPMSAGRRAEE